MQAECRPRSAGLLGLSISTARLDAAAALHASWRTRTATLPYWIRVVLVCSASTVLTSMLCASTGCLGDCIEHCSSVEEALEQYEAKRLPQTSKEVLFSRHLGRVKQALDSSVDCFNAGSEQCSGLAQANMSSFTPDDCHAPSWS